MCMAESSNFRYLMAFDRSGFCHMMDSGNLDGNKSRVQEIFESPVMFQKTPAQSTKGHQIDMFFSNTTSGTLYFFDRNDFSQDYNFKRAFTISGSSPKILHHETIDIPESFNVLLRELKGLCLDVELVGAKEEREEIKEGETKTE